MNSPPIPIFLNPSAGSGRAVKAAAKIEAELGRAGVPHIWTITRCEAHLRELTRRAAASGSIVVGAGGDSTFMIMAEEILAAGGNAALGMIGLGSSNDIPSAFGLDSVEAACAALGQGRRRRIDLGMVTREGDVKAAYFLGQANLGLGAAVNKYVADLAGKRPKLAARQTFAGFLGISEAYRRKTVPVWLRIEAGPEGVIEGSFTLAVFANTPIWATGKRIAPAAKPDDGLLDACLIGRCSMRRLARLYSLASTGRHVDEPEVRIVRVPEFIVHSDHAPDVQADGEIIFPAGAAEKNTLVIRALPSALDLIVPA